MMTALDPGGDIATLHELRRGEPVPWYLEDGDDLAERILANQLHSDGGDGPADPLPEGEVDLGDEWRHTDVGNASRLVHAFGTRIRHVGPWGTWLIWDRRRWRTDTRGEIVELAKRIPRALWAQAQAMEPGDEQKQARIWAAKSEAAQRIEAMVRLARSDARVAIDPQDLDSDPWILNLANGTVDLRTGQLAAHDPAQLLTKVAPVRLDLDAAAPLWEAFLAAILPDPDVRMFVQRWLGYCLTGNVAEHKLVFAFGAGANGKTTLLNVIARILGDYARQAPPDLLMRRRDEPHPTGLADLQGARLVLASETAQGRHLDEALVKRLTGGDPIKARKMFADFFEFQPTHKLVVATNHRPGVDGTDHGIWRRIRLVPFDVTIPDDEQDHQLEDKLAAEAPGVLAWAVRGCLDWQHHGLTEPTAVTAATADYRADMDVLGEFISDSCVLAHGVNAKASDLYGAYSRWCEAAGERASNQRQFGRSLRERGLTKYTNNGVWWQGIGLSFVGTEPSDDRRFGETAGQGQQPLPDGTFRSGF